MLKKITARISKWDRKLTLYLREHSPRLYKYRLSLDMAYNSLILWERKLAARHMTDQQREKHIAIQYQKKTGKTLDWNHLVTYREKMQ